MPAVSRPLLIFHSIFLQTLFKMSFATFLFSNSGSQSSLCLGFTPRKLSACLPTSGHSRIITERNILRIIQLLTFSPFFGRQIKVIAPLRLLSLRILSPLSSLLLLPKMPLTLTAHTWVLQRRAWYCLPRRSNLFADLLWLLTLTLLHLVPLNFEIDTLGRSCTTTNNARNEWSATNSRTLKMTI